MAKKKCSMKATVSIILLITVMYLMFTSSVFAATTIDATFSNKNIKVTGSVNGNWDVFKTTSNAITASLEPKSDGNTNPTYSAQTDTVTFTNNNTGTAVVSFKYKLTTTTGSATVNGKKATTTEQTATITMAGGSSFTVVLTSGASKEADGAIAITNFDVAVEETNTIILNTPVNGSYKVSSTNGDAEVTMTPGSAATEYHYVSTAGIKVVATPSANYKFDRIENGTTGAVLTYTNSSTIATGLENGNSLTVQFLSSNYTRAFTVGDNMYYSWEDAMDDALNSKKPVVLNQTSYTLPATEEQAIAAGEKMPNAAKDNGVTHIELVNKGGTNYVRYLVPSGVTFGIPFDSSLSLEENNLNQTTAKVGKPAYTLTVKSGTELVVRNGATFIVNAMQTCSGTPTQGVTGGNYGKLVMGGTMTLEGGSKSYFRGYVMDTDHTSHSYGTGTGRIIAQNQAYVEVLFQIMTHRGGNAMVNTVMSNKDKRIMPVTNYYIGNIMMHAEVESGATVSARYNFYIKGYYPGNVSLVAPSGTANTMFSMSSDARLIMDYDYATDRMILVAQKGSVSVENVKMTFSYSLVDLLSPVEVPIDSSKMVMALTDNMQVYVGEPNVENPTVTAEVNVSKPIKMLPGAAFHVMKNGTLNISSENYLYAAADYDTAWSYSAYRSSLFISETYRNRAVGTTGADIISVTDDAAIYLEGTLNVDGTLLQSSQNAVEKNNRIIPTADTAVLNINKLATSGTIYELIGTEGFYTNSDWKVLDGVFAGSTELADFPSTGTYKAVEQDSMYKWYNYKVTYVFQDEAGNPLTGLLTEDQNPMYVVGNSTTLAASSLAGGKYVIKGYSIVDSTGADITATAAVAAGAEDPNAANAVSYGWENLTFSNLTDDITVTLTVAPYENRVHWTANAKGGTAANAVWTDYVMDTARYTPNVDTACIFEPLITAVEGGTTTGIAMDTEYLTDADGKTASTFVVSGIPNDINVSVQYDSSTCKVIWNVTNWDGSTSAVSKYVSKGGNMEYEVKQPDNEWRIITYHSVPDTVTSVNATANKIELTGVNDTTEVDLTITRYDYALSVTGTIAQTDPTNAALGPFYLNKGESQIITGSDFIEGKRFTFTNINSKTPETMSVVHEPEQITLTAPEDYGAKAISALVELDAYDYKVVVKDDSATLATQYIDGNSTSYTFDSGYYVKDYTATGTATVEAVNPTADTAAALNITEIESDVTVKVTTAKYDHILTLVDADNNLLSEPLYVLGTSYTYNIAHDVLNYITDAKVVSDSAVGSATLSETGGKSMQITGISGNPTVQLTMQAYKYTVNWNDKEGNHLRTDYILENQTETSYTCDAGYVAQLSSVGAATGSQHTVTTADNKTYKVANISSDMTVVLELIAYDHAVTIDDGTVKETWYVKNDEDVLNGGSIYYQVDNKKYIDAYTLSGTATIDGSDNVNETVSEGWERVDITGIKSDVVLTLSVKDYDYKVTWNVTVSVNSEDIVTKKLHYVTGTSDSYDVGSFYSIASKKTTNGTVTNEGSIVTVSGLTGNASVTVEARDFLYEITWIYTQAGEKHEDIVTYQQADVQADGSVKWTVPASSDGETYVITGATLTGGTATHTNKTITVLPTGSKVTVNLDLEIALTNYKALWGEMSYKYYKNGAFYSKTESGDGYEWKLMDSYAWTPKAGSMFTSYAGETYTVPNGSVMIVNPTNQTVQATITVSMNYNESDWEIVPTMTLIPERGEPVTTENGTATMTITLAPHTNMIVTGTMEGAPLDATILEDVNGGSWSVSIDPID